MSSSFWFGLGQKATVLTRSTRLNKHLKIIVSECTEKIQDMRPKGISETVNVLLAEKSRLMLIN
jgi:hypothetical protein